MSLPPGLSGRAFAREIALDDWSAADLRRARRRGVVRLLGRGVYLDGELPPDERTRLLATLVRSRAAVASHATALRLWGVPNDDDRLHVTVPAPAAIRSAPGLVVHRDVLATSSTTLRHGLLTTNPTRTALDIARASPLVEAVSALDALLTAERLEREALLDHRRDLAGLRGAVTARRALELCRYGAGSPGETRLRLALVTRGVPEPALQHRIDAEQTVVVDLAWPSARLAVEYDGYGPHTERRTFERDRRRWSWLRAADWDLRAYTAESLRRPDEVAREVFAILAARGVEIHRRRVTRR